MVLSMGFVTAQNEHANENATVDGGWVSTMDNTSICLGDENPDIINAVVEGASGRVKQWIVTDTDENILDLPESVIIDFSTFEPGDYRIYHLSYNGIKPLWHKHVKNLSDLLGRYHVSHNYIDVLVQQKPTGGTLEGGPFEFCVGDGEADHIPEGAITLSGNMGANSQWVVTNADGSEILGLPPNSYTEVNFDEAPAGTCLVWHLMYEDGISGLEVGNNPADLIGCFEFSDFVTVIRKHTEGGTLEGGPFEFCVGDGEADHIPEGAITLTGNEGASSQWVVTNEDGTVILGLPPNSYSEVNFDEAPAGTCLVWHLSYEWELEGLEVDGLVADIMGCFSLSNAVEVIRHQPDGGTITGGPFEFTVGDEVADNIATDSISLADNVGSMSKWVFTDKNAEKILILADDYTEPDFDETEADTCLVWHLSYEEGIVGLVQDSLVMNLEGCYDFSNALEIIKTESSSTGKIALYPNPSKSSVTVDLSKFVSGNTSVKIYSLQRNLLFNANYGKTIKKIPLHTNDLESGIYFVSVTNIKTGIRAVKRLVVE
ncbi:hypothetical protein GCM10022395_14290 [Snuella lapsa]|uniref:Secretion system C-terminal sorting domain-containing protein n=2 Tax=Snuella lapsa TaxID=870481 RepID=A0ABP6XES3_9FLAO